MTMDELRTGSTTSFAAFLQQRASKRKKSSNTAALAAVATANSSAANNSRHKLLSSKLLKQQSNSSSVAANNLNVGTSNNSGFGGQEPQFTRSQEIELKLNCASMEYRLPRFETLVEHLQSRKMRALEEAVGGFGGSDLTNTDQTPSKKGASFFDKDSLWNNSSPTPAFDQADFDLDGIVITSSSKNRRPSRADELQQLFATKNYDLLLKELLPLVAQLLNLVESSGNQHIVEGAAVYLLWVFFDASSLNHLANSGNSGSNGTTQQQQQPQQNQNLQSLGLGLGMFGPAGMGGSSSSSNNNNSSSSNHFGNSKNSNNNSNSNSSSSTFSSIATINLAALGANYPSLEYLFCLDSLNGGILERIGYVARSLFELMEPVYLNTVFYHASMIRKAARDVEAQEVQQQSTPLQSNNGGDQNGAAAAQEQEDWFSRLEQKLLGSKKTSTEDEEEEVAGDEVDSPVSSSSSSSPFTVDPFENDVYNFFPLNGEDRRLVEKSAGTAFSTHFNFEHPNAEFVFQALLSGGRLPPLPADIANLNLNGSTAAAANAQGEVGGSVKFPEQQRKQFEAVSEVEDASIFASQQTSSSTGGSSAEDAIGLLFSELATFIATYNSTHLGEQYYLSHEELFNTVLSWIIDQQQGQQGQQGLKNGDETLGTELTNLLGEDSASLITKIITVYKPAILKSSSSLSGSGTSAAAKNVNNSGRNNNNTNSSLERAETLWRKVCQAKGLQGSSNSAITGPTNLGPSIVVHTEKEKVLKKEMRKIEKKFNKELSKAAKLTGADELAAESEALTLADLERMREANLKANIRAALEPKLKEDDLRPAREPIEQYPHVYDLLQTIKTTASYVGDSKLLLPLGVEKRDHRTHEEVAIPLISSNEATKAFLSTFPSIAVADADEFVRTGFQGFTRLNLIQSTVFQTAYQSDNQNMLICAPTGAGKTNIAMLAVLNILKNYSVDGVSPRGGLQLDQFKIVYIAPMKALCAEMTASFGKRLAPFGVNVRELTGDMQLTSKEILETQMLVVTPEKWDVVTRKSVGDVQLLDLVRLIIIDEVHLLQSDRGHVLETLVARTVRYVEQAQKCIRLVGLSATLPSYLDVARFLHVDLYRGLFVFDERFRPVPLQKCFIGVKGQNKQQLNSDMDEITFGKVREMLVAEEQVMVFVHSRNATLNLGGFLIERAQYARPEEDGGMGSSSSSSSGAATNIASLFKADTEKLAFSEKLISRARYRNLNRLLLNGVGVHHAGMPRAERNIVEKLFRAGVIKVLVCTSTLAWGVNLPAHAVIIRGTEFYDPAAGHLVDLDMLDVMQIFGRAGRPQYDTSGLATIITTHSKLAHYLSMLTNQLPIESRFLKRLTDNLNAEIVLGTVGNIGEAVEWLKYTYAYIRMAKNPMEYGLSFLASLEPSIIVDHLYSLVRTSAEALDRAEMVRYCPDLEGSLDSTHLGRIASHYYIQHETIVHFNEGLRANMDFGHIFDLLSKANEFSQLRFREDEFKDLDELRFGTIYHTKGEMSNTPTKVNILMQAAISRVGTDCHSLSSDLNYILQNVSRLTRGLFEYVIKRGWPLLAERFLSMSLMFEKRIWFFDTPLLQFESEIPHDVLEKLSEQFTKGQLHLYDLREYSADEIGDRLRHRKSGALVKKYARMVPSVEITATVKPITRTILTVYLDVKPDFVWEDRLHGKTAQLLWIWLTDTANNHIYHAELGRFTKKQVVKEEVAHYVFTIPLLDASHLQQQYLVHATFEYWLGTDQEVAVSCEGMLLPDRHLPNTPLLDLMPLPVTALQNDLYAAFYRFSHFNPIQTQIFHTLYQTDRNVLLGAPTGSGKTVAAEIAIFRVFNTQPGRKVVYIAPLKALVRERVDDWKVKLERNLGRRVVELTGDTTPDIGAIQAADLIVTTPEKWDGVSRGWPSRSYVREVALIVIDEIHLLGEERGPVLEMIVSRANFISRRTSASSSSEAGGPRMRILGLSTAVANAQDLAAWLSISKVGLYNFSPSVRPVPIEVHVSGFSGKHYCPRMASMNKPAYRAIKKFSPEKPVIIFVSSRRQTRLTALDLITLIAGDAQGNGSYLRMAGGEEELEAVLSMVSDGHLKHTLRFGIGMHHAGLREGDRKVVEELFAAQKILVLITTATLAWGVNLPAHAVIIKGTEFFDGKKGRYVDFPITDVLQMIGRAGRPQFDTSAVAVLFVHDIKKEYYKKFLYEPFPVESHLLEVFSEHLNAEVAAGTVGSKHEAMEYLASTYLYQRIVKNPSYYGVDLTEIGLTQEELARSELAVNTAVVRFLSGYIDRCVKTLEEDYCLREVVESGEEDSGEESKESTSSLGRLVATPLGKIASYYYLSHRTVRLFQDALGSIGDGSQKPPYLPLRETLDLLTNAPEYATLPVRHNEEHLNEELSRSCPIKLQRRSMESPHTKANLLLQAHCSRLPLPIVDYYTDTKTVLDQAIRILQAAVDIAALNGSLGSTLNLVALQQSILQACWQSVHGCNPLITLVDTELQASKPVEFKDGSLNEGNAFFEDHQALSKTASMLKELGRVPPELASIPLLLNVVHGNSATGGSSGGLTALKALLAPHHLPGRLVDRLHRSLLQLPVVEVEEVEVVEEVGGEEGTTGRGSSQKIPKSATFSSSKDQRWVSLKADTEYTVHVRLRRRGGGAGAGGAGGSSRGGRGSSKAFCPRFPKPKSESWYLVLGDPDRGELLTMARVAAIPAAYSGHQALTFRTPAAVSGGGKLLYSLYLLSDCYIGLDQQYTLPFAVGAV